MSSRGSSKRADEPISPDDMEVTLVDHTEASNATKGSAKAAESTPTGLVDLSAKANDTQAFAKKQQNASGSASIKVERDPPGVQRGCCSSKPLPPEDVAPYVNDPVSTIELKKICLIYNPFSGGKKGAQIANRICKIFAASSIEVVKTATEHAGHAMELCRDKDYDGHDAVVIVGGDGTFHEAVNGIFKRENGAESFPPLGLIPGGTGNSVMTDLKQLDIETACKQIIKGNLRMIDVGKVDAAGYTTYSINLISWGIGVQSTMFAEKLRWLGPARYNVGILVKIMQLPSNYLKIEIDGDVFEGEYNVVTITNNQYGGSGLRLSPYARMDDGLFDLTISKKSNRGELLNLFGELKRGGSHVYHSDAEYRQGKKITFTTKEPTPVVIDGEIGGPMHVTPLVCECLPRSLKFLN